jgi:regulator of replication initiation timing
MIDWIALSIGALAGFGCCATLSRSMLIRRLSGVAKLLSDINISQETLRNELINYVGENACLRLEADLLKRQLSTLATLKTLFAHYAANARREFDAVESDFEMTETFSAQSLTAMFARHLHTWAAHQTWRMLATPDAALESRPYDAQFFSAATECHADLTVFRQLQQQIQPIAAPLDGAAS